MEGVHCGESLTISITAFDDECASPQTLGLPAETGEVSDSEIYEIRMPEFHTKSQAEAFTV